MAITINNPGLRDPLTDLPARRGYNPPPPLANASLPGFPERGTPAPWLDETPAKSRDAKLTNPKDAVGSDKLPLHLVPDSLVAYASLAFLEGALKYGQFNWRVAGVRASIYLSAMERHMRKWKAGEWADQKTGVPHLASIVACAAIIMDAELCGKLNDDRPPEVARLPEVLDGLAAEVVRLKEIFKDHNPTQYTRQNAPLEVPT